MHTSLSLVAMLQLLTAVTSLAAELSLSHGGALRPVGSFRTKDQTGVSCIAKWMREHGTTRDALRDRFAPSAARVAPVGV